MMPTITGFDWTAFGALSGQRDQREFMRDWRQDQRGILPRDQFRTQWDQLKDYQKALFGKNNPAAPVAPQQATQPAYVQPVLPQGPAGMVGASYAVQGMTPATSGFGLPTY